MFKKAISVLRKKLWGFITQNFPLQTGQQRQKVCCTKTYGL